MGRSLNLLVDLKWECVVIADQTVQYPMSRKTKKNVVKHLVTWINHYGAPEILQSDNGREFCNDLVTALANQHGFKIKHGLPRTPRVQGLVEQANGTMKTRLSKWRLSHSDQPWCAPLFSPHRS